MVCVVYSLIFKNILTTLLALTPENNELLHGFYMLALPWVLLASSASWAAFFNGDWGSEENKATEKGYKLGKKVVIN